MPAPEIQLDRLRKFVTSNQAAHRILNYAIGQTSIAIGATSPVDGLHRKVNRGEGPKLKRRETVSTLRELTQIGCGRFYVGRHGQPSRFVWAIAPSTLRAALTSPPQVSVVPKAPTPSSAESGMVNHSFRLRRGLSVSMCFPEDLSASEADRLSRFIQALPFQVAAV